MINDNKKLKFTKSDRVSLLNVLKNIVIDNMGNGDGEIDKRKNRSLKLIKKDLIKWIDELENIKEK